VSRSVPFLTRAHEGGLLFDGAIGTQLYERGVFLNQCFEHINLTQPTLVKQIHREYFEVGAEVITTNTFGANRMRLVKHGLSDQVETLNQAGVRLAREVIGRRGYVAGSVGPTGVKLDDLSRSLGQDAREALTEQIKILVESDVDVICLETFSVLQELEMAIRIAKQFDIPIVALYTFQPTGLGLEGQKPYTVAQRLIEAGAGVIGSNCGGGPEMLFKVTTPMVELGCPVLAQANAGKPELIEGRSIYVANQEYFSVFARRLLKAGVKLIGGCCGTTPYHIQKMANATRMLSPKSERRFDLTPSASISLESRSTTTLVDPHPKVNKQEAIIPLAERSHLGALIARGVFVTSVEVNPPASFNLTRKIEASQALAKAGVTTINIADGPRASLRMSNLVMAQQIQQQTPLSPIVHVCCRDRSFLGLQSHLLGAHVMGVRNLVVITGDPPKMGPYPHSSGVYDLDSIELLRIIRGYNHGVDPAGKEMPEPTSFVCATGAEPAAIDYERELRRLELKRDAGAELVMTQPIYNARQIERFLIDARTLGLPIMLGLCPLASYRNALFLHNNVPGMQVPDEVLSRMKQAEERGSAEEEGVKIAREALLAVKDHVQGAYIMPPFARYHLATQVLDGLISPIALDTPVGEESAR
jgi:methionine synthase / methylenetetrahydrofolate reductase(NADPH)